MRIKLQNTVEHNGYIYHAGKQYRVTIELAGILMYKDRKITEKLESELAKKLQKKSSKSNDKIN